MRRLTFVLLVVGLALVLVAALWGLFGGTGESTGPWMPQLVPSGARIVVRLDSTAVRESPLGAALADSQPFADLRRELGVDAQAIEPLEQLEQRLRAATHGLVGADQVLEDIFGGELILAGDGTDWVLLSRLSGGVDAALRLGLLGDDVLAEAGLERRGGLLVLEAGEITLLATIREDVLVVSTAAEWVQESLASGGSTAAPDSTSTRRRVPDWTEPAGAVVSAWIDVAGLFGADGPAPPGSGEAFLRALAPPEGLEPLQIELGTLSAEQLEISIRGRFRDRPTPAVAGITASVNDTASLSALAASFAVADEAMAVAGSPARPADVLLGLIHGQPASRRELVRQHLERDGLTPEQVAAELGARFDTGVALVVARMGEAGDIPLDRWNDGAAHPIPATLLAFRLAERTSAADVLADLERFGEILLGDPLDPVARSGPGGAVVHRCEDASLGRAWQLLRPCVAFVDDLCVFSTSEAFLERALERRAGSGAGRGARAIERGGSALTLTVAGDPLRAHVDDLRWEYAEQATNRDWAHERRRLGVTLDAAQPSLPAIDREQLLDERMDALIERRNEEDFPAAIELWRRHWSPLRGLRNGRLDAWTQGPTFELKVRIELDR